jgi:hypothetical protein
MSLSWVPTGGAICWVHDNVIVEDVGQSHALVLHHYQLFTRLSFFQCYHAYLSRGGSYCHLDGLLQKYMYLSSKACLLAHQLARLLGHLTPLKCTARSCDIVRCDDVRLQFTWQTLRLAPTTSGKAKSHVRHMIVYVGIC